MSNLFRVFIAAATSAVAALSAGIGRADEFPRGVPAAMASGGESVNQEASAVRVVLDFAKIMSFAQPARTIIIGNPAVVDGTLNNENTIVLTGKAVGTTNMIVLGEGGEEIANVTITVAANTRQLTTVHHGAAQQTYSCSGPCRPLAAPSEIK